MIAPSGGLQYKPSGGFWMSRWQVWKMQWKQIHQTDFLWLFIFVSLCWSGFLISVGGFPLLILEVWAHFGHLHKFLAVNHRDSDFLYTNVWPAAVSLVFCRHRWFKTLSLFLFFSLSPSIPPLSLVQQSTARPCWPHATSTCSPNRGTWWASMR